MFEPGLSLALEFGDDALGQDLAQLNTPLVKGIDVPYCPLGEDAVLIKRNQFTEGGRRQSVDQNDIGWPITLEHPMRNEPIGRAFGLYLLARLAERECLGLGEDVRDEHVMMPTQGIERVTEHDEIGRNQLRPLMDQLIERVLTVGSRLAPVDGSGLVTYFGSLERDVLAIALHRQLLEIGREALEVLLVRK